MSLRCEMGPATRVHENRTRLHFTEGDLQEFLIGSLSDVSDGAVAQFMIGANSGGGLDPHIHEFVTRLSIFLWC